MVENGLWNNVDAKQMEALEETMALLLVVATQNSVDKEKVDRTTMKQRYCGLVQQVL